MLAVDRALGIPGPNLNNSNNETVPPQINLGETARAVQSINSGGQRMDNETRVRCNDREVDFIFGVL